ncbi:MAG TPA: type I methionyl aminopeptidase [Mycoplasmatales bacterium]|jgi:methionyl aminopeptidase|nr:type I methionyl aminopeptidase [Mycoplasmatales bacterium]
MKIKNLRYVSSVISLIFKEIESKVVVGCSGKKLEEISLNLMKKYKVKSSAFKYGGFPSHICVSINAELTHGIPKLIPFKEGDIVSVDISCNYHGVHSDAARTYLVFDENKKTKENFTDKLMLIEAAREALNKAIVSIIPGKTTNKDLGLIIQNSVEEKGFFTIKEYGGHGIGNNLHEDPFIPNYKNMNDIPEVVIKPGMAICIEPLVQVGNDETVVSKDGFTVISKNGELNTHFEHTILIKSNEVEILV